MREKDRTFADLIVWQKAHRFVLGVYGITRHFPSEETYGLTQQFSRAAVLIAANIPEGFRRRTIAEKGRFLDIAQGSLEECRYYLILERDLNCGESKELISLIEEVSKLPDA